MATNRAPSGYSKLPSKIIENSILPNCELKSASKLALTTKFNNTLFQKCKQFEPIKMACFIHYVASKRALLNIESMLKVEKKVNTSQQKPGMSLALRKSSFTDSGGRNFINFSAIQYAWWAYDRHMLAMLMKSLSTEEKIVARKQIKELADKKLRFDFTPLKQAYETYIKTPTKIKLYDIGGEQRLSPLHVLNEYCRRDDADFSKLTNRFREESLPCCFEVDDIDNTCIVACFPFEDNKGLGHEYAIFRGDWSQKAILRRGGVSFDYVARVDLKAICQLEKVAEEEMAKLLEPVSTMCLIM
jgi:hypothetical protein